MNFKEFFIETENNDDVEGMLKKLPKRHQNIIKDYKFKYISTATLKNDKTHVGEIDEKSKKITVASPWNYGREVVLLHEIAHKVWETLDKDVQTNWRAILKNHPSKDEKNQSAEEYFCMGYATCYCNNPVSKYDIPAWKSFIKSLE